jgi:hypothetical protein
MTVGELRKLLADTPVEYDGFEVVDDATGLRMALSWNVTPVAGGAERIGHTYGQALFLSDAGVVE